MNFDDDQHGSQRPISSGPGSLDEKIAGSPSPYQSKKRKVRSNEPETAEVAGEPVEIRPADVLSGRSKTSFNHGTYYL